MASNDDPQPEVHEYTGLHDWAESTGVELPEPEPEAVDPADAAERIERLWANAASPDEFPALREHRVEQDGEAAVLPAEVRTAAQDAAEALRYGGRKPRRRRGRGKPRAEAGEPAEPPVDPMEAALDAIEDLLDAKGGVARKALARVLRLPLSTSAVRDIDLLRIGGTPPEHDQRLAEVYMTDDVIHGDAEVEEIVSPLDYLTSREFTVNEVLFVDGVVRITPMGLLDTLGGVVRITQAHLNRNRGRVHPVVGFKALRFAGTGRHEGNNIRVARFRLSYRPRAHPLAFFFALQLSRAFEADPAIAELYMGMAQRRGFLEHVGLEEDITAPEAAALLKERLPGYYLEFPGSGLTPSQTAGERGKMPVEKGKRKRRRKAPGGVTRSIGRGGESLGRDGPREDCVFTWPCRHVAAQQADAGNKYAICSMTFAGWVVSPHACVLVFLGVLAVQNAVALALAISRPRRSRPGRAAR